MALVRPFASSSRHALAAAEDNPVVRPVNGSSEVTLSESVETVLAKNLVVARVAVGITQHGLASAADVSRATVSQLETGCADPRISTVAALARALGIPPIFLLLGIEELRVLESLAEGNHQHAAPVSPEILQAIRRLVQTGMLKDRLEAGRLAAEASRAAGYTHPASHVATAICAAIEPQGGASMGALLGQLLGERLAPRT